jgi:hypothetical protein
MSADLTGFPLNADGTVSVIIQFNQTPKARHFDDMSAQGGRLKFSLSRINGAAYRIPVRMLVWLQNHPDVAYVSPDRPNKVAANSPDDDIPAVMGDVASQQYGLNGTGVGVAVIDSGVFNHDDLKTYPLFGDGAWTREEMADIDMDRWMAKSIAWLVHTDNRRLKLDAYLHKDLHLIIGAIASRLYPDQWDDQAKPIKADQPAASAAGDAPASSEAGVGA